MEAMQEYFFADAGEPAMGKLEVSKVLILDDEAVIRDILARQLVPLGYECRAVGTVSSALELLSKQDFDVLLCDLRLPDGSGLEIVQHLTQREAETVVIVLTGLADAKLAVEAMKAGACDYLVKPIAIEQLDAAIRWALVRRQEARGLNGYNLRLEGAVRRQTGTFSENFLNVIKPLAQALEAKDPYTINHSQRVTALADALGLGMGLKEGDALHVAGLLHDLGKVEVSETILNKSGQLSREEFRHLMRHPVTSEQILQPLVTRPEITRMVRHHHERYDGEGYPDGLTATDIPLGARVLAVADAFDAMTSHRVYRRRLSLAEAAERIQANSGSHFDPEVTTFFLTVIERR